MEVHAHTHTPRKKWTHYFWEFFMLFLAVTLGFFVENQREHYIEHKREVEYIRSMIADLKEDTASFNQVIKINLTASEKIDTLIALLKEKERNVSAKRIYYLARTIPLSDANLVCQDKTFEQLKGSGGLRLIRNPATLNKIGAYYQINKSIESGPTPMQYQNRRDLFLSFDELFDAETLQEIMRSPEDWSARIPDDHFILLSDDPKVINRFCIRYHIMFSTKRVVSNEAKHYVTEAASLIMYLQKEYHLE
jgi:hypothetical protein